AEWMRGPTVDERYFYGGVVVAIGLLAFSVWIAGRRVARSPATRSAAFRPGVLKRLAPARVLPEFRRQLVYVLTTVPGTLTVLVAIAIVLAFGAVLRGEYFAMGAPKT